LVTTDKVKWLRTDLTAFTVSQQTLILSYKIHRPYNNDALKPINLLTDNRKGDRQFSVPSAEQSTDCVDIASGSVLPVALWSWSCMQFEVAERQEVPAVSVHYVKFYCLYASPYINGIIELVTSSGTVSFSRSTVLHAFHQFYTVLLPTKISVHYYGTLLNVFTVYVAVFTFPLRQMLKPLLVHEFYVFKLTIVLTPYYGL